MTPGELLDEVVDRDTFIAFVKALASEREAAERLEKAQPTRYCLGGAHDWQNADIASFLYAALAYFEDKPLLKPEKTPSWRMFADFLYCGKIYE
jgi:hypothetical protein